ncbi:MAG TPA: hypothetical protein VGW12_10810 [Pyrinomonadaceae bacterium]|nr:hypothetical protein [Pyrinomonadaceae bacterium]
MAEKTTKKPQGKVKTYRFNIGAFSPETMPLGRLAEYLAELSVLLGENKSVHLIDVEEGSTVVRVLVDEDAESIVRENIAAVERNEAPPERMKAAAKIKEKLRQDNASGASLVDPRGSNVIAFPAREVSAPLAYGPFTQPGVIVGVPRVVGGDNDPVPVHLRGGDGRTHNCLANEEVARAIAVHLFKTYIRAEGMARWERSAAGEWVMRRFKIRTFKPLSDSPLRAAIEDLRAIPAEWKQKEDPLGELNEIRHGEADDIRHGTDG